VTTALEEPVDASPRFSHWLRRFWVPLVLVVAALGVSGTITVMHGDSMSPIDEWVYSDYLDKLPEQGVVYQGEAIGDQALERMACDGVLLYGPMGPDCGDDYGDLSEFPFSGITSADAYTPVYFAITRVVGDGIAFVTGADELTGWRLTGPVWLAATMIVFWLLLRRWNVPPLATLGLGLTLLASPFGWWTYTWVSTDAPSFLAGALMLLLASRYAYGKGSGWWLALVAALALAFKTTNILAVCLAALYLLIVWLSELRATEWIGIRTRRPIADGRSSFALPGFAVLALVAAAATQFGWLAIRQVLAKGEPANQAIAGQLDRLETLSQMANFLPGTITSNVNLVGTGDYALPFPNWSVMPLSWLCIAGVIGAFWQLSGTSKRSPLVIAIAISAIAFAPMLAIVIQLTTGSYFPLPPRYGAPILAGFLLAAGMTMRNRWAHWLLLAYAVPLIAATLYLTALLAKY
jgi:hypothetical protein